MLSLFEQSLLVKTSKLGSLNEVLLCFEELPCTVDPTKLSRSFWELLLPEIGHTKTLLCFKELSDELWPQLINSLCNDIYHKYIYFVDYEFQLEIRRGELVIGGLYTNLKAPSILNEYEYNVDSIYTPAVNLSSGSKVWIIHFKIDDRHQRTLMVLSSKNRHDPNHTISIIASLLIDHIHDNHEDHDVSIVDKNVEDIPKIKYSEHSNYPIFKYDLSNCQRVHNEKGSISKRKLMELLMNVFKHRHEHAENFAEEFDTQGCGYEHYSLVSMRIFHGHKSQKYYNKEFNALMVKDLYSGKSKIEIVLQKRIIV